VVLLPLLLLLAGCTARFPESTRVLGEWEHAGLAAGENATLAFEVQGADYLFIGHRLGPGDRVDLSLVAPDGTRFAAEAGEPAQPCVVRAPRAGSWALRVEANAWDGQAGPGKVTVRSGLGEVPSILPCADDAYPGALRPVILAVWSGNVTGAGEVLVRFDQPYELRNMTALARNATANLTFALHGPDGSAANTTAEAPVTGMWALRVGTTGGQNETSPILNLSLAVRGLGR
jgi:hypothetical protein